MAAEATPSNGTERKCMHDLIDALREDVEARAPRGDRPLYRLGEIEIASGSWVSEEVAVLPAQHGHVHSGKVSSRDVEDYLDELSAGIILQILREFRGRLVLAGGSVTGIIRSVTSGVPPKINDYDLFVVEEDGERANDLLHQVLVRICKLEEENLLEKNRAALNPRNPRLNYDNILRIQRSRGVTTVLGAICGKIQVIHRINSSPADVLYGFDLGSCSMGAWCDPSSGELRACASAMGRFALNYCVNVLDPTRMSTTYASRISKYMDRGFGLIMPEVSADALKEIKTFNAHRRTSQYVKMPVVMGVFIVAPDRHGWSLNNLTPQSVSDYGMGVFANEFCYNLKAINNRLRGVDSFFISGGSYYSLRGARAEEYGIMKRQRLDYDGDVPVVLPAEVDHEQFVRKCMELGPHIISGPEVVQAYGHLFSFIDKASKSGVVNIPTLKRFLASEDIMPFIRAIVARKGLEEETKKLKATAAHVRDRVLEYLRTLADEPVTWAHLTPAQAQGFRITGSFKPVAITPEEMGGEAFKRHPVITDMFHSVLPLAIEGED